MAQPAEPTRPLTPEEEAALAAIVADTGPPPQPVYIPESSAPPPTPPADESYTLPPQGSRGPFTVPTGWQHGTVGTGGGTAGGMMTSYPGGGGGGLSLSQLGDDNPMRVQGSGQGVTPGGGSLLSPSYVPREPGPGQYEPAYREPGWYTHVPVYQPPTTDTDAYEPGMYAGRYERPGQAVPPTPATEPGMYEPHYTQPGYYTPRSASTYYGGEIWPTPYTGKERLETSGTIQFGPNPAGVQVIDPTTGETTFRGVPDLGTATVVMEGPERYHDTQPNPALTNRGQLFGGNAPPTPTVTLGPTSSQMGYLASQGDPRVTRNAEGDLVLTKDLASRNPPVLGGLFGGTNPRTIPGRYRPLPVPKGG